MQRSQCCAIAFCESPEGMRREGPGPAAGPECDFGLGVTKPAYFPEIGHISPLAMG